MGKWQRFCSLLIKKCKKKDHPYFAQMKGQMFLLGVRFCDVFMLIPVENDYLLVRIERNENCVSEILPKSNYFFAFLFPELVIFPVTYCYCKRITTFVRGHVLRPSYPVAKLTGTLIGIVLFQCQSLQHQNDHGHALRDITLIKSEASLWNFCWYTNKKLQF